MAFPSELWLIVCALWGMECAYMFVKGFEGI